MVTVHFNFSTGFVFSSDGNDYLITAIIPFNFGNILRRPCLLKVRQQTMQQVVMSGHIQA